MIIIQCLHVTCLQAACYIQGVANLLHPASVAGESTVEQEHIIPTKSVRVIASEVFSSTGHQHAEDLSPNDDIPKESFLRPMLVESSFLTDGDNMITKSELGESSNRNES